MLIRRGMMQLRGPRESCEPRTQDLGIISFRLRFANYSFGLFTQTLPYHLHTLKYI